mmetsp:Transcript_52382/g.157196  ORF Transcript_52382/g.157196 Transcript_52382/m.157196 type:complete len:101 (+) Transcript_52382:1367-1669(+)
MDTVTHFPDQNAPTVEMFSKQLFDSACQYEWSIPLMHYLVEKCPHLLRVPDKDGILPLHKSSSRVSNGKRATIAISFAQWLAFTQRASTIETKMVTLPFM